MWPESQTQLFEYSPDLMRSGIFSSDPFCFSCGPIRSDKRTGAVGSLLLRLAFGYRIANLLHAFHLLYIMYPHDMRTVQDCAGYGSGCSF
jgi:hypothetical protein